MNEIEKMYRNAGVKHTKNWQSCLNCELKTETYYDEWGEEYTTCLYLERPEKCPNAKRYYPIFTAEKEIELIKLIACNKINKSYRYISLDKDEIDSRWYISLTKETVDNATSYSGKNINFGEALAELINSLWQDLTEEERSQIKEILE